MSSLTMSHPRFDKTDTLRVVRALSIFRPSLIALQMPLTEEDEIFVEKCFQRTLIEFDKLITFSGTPTVVWRRTGEISLVGVEFSLLTEWDRGLLLGKKTFIYEVSPVSCSLQYHRSDILFTTAAIRQLFDGRVLGEVFDSCVREHDSVSLPTLALHLKADCILVR